MPAIEFRHITKSFVKRSAYPTEEGTRPAAVDDVTLEVEEGELVVLLGPSGCGKTTLLRMVNRLIEPSEGELLVDGVEVRQISATQLRRHIGYVIQQTGLFPHMSVAANIATVPKLLGWQKQRINQRIDELLILVDLPPREYRKRYPAELSGGQQQRVGIARAMAADPSVMLMDEPFGAIDAITRRDLQNALLDIQSKVSKTIMFVTHDVDEALRLADRIAVMRSGRVVQYDRPYNLLSDPADAFVEALLDTEDAVRRLSLIPVSDIMDNPNGARTVDHLVVADNGNAREALSILLSRGAQELSVVDRDGHAVGSLTLGRILDEARREDVPVGKAT
ncbi:MAG: ABC transporter ATP-binding protein [Chloroflexota bacterium]